MESFSVIASEAKQSSFLACGSKAGLLRRFAPRNDAEGGAAQRNPPSRVDQMADYALCANPPLRTAWQSQSAGAWGLQSAPPLSSTLERARVAICDPSTRNRGRSGKKSSSEPTN